VVALTCQTATVHTGASAKGELGIEPSLPLQHTCLPTAIHRTCLFQITQILTHQKSIQKDSGQHTPV